MWAPTALRRSLFAALLTLPGLVVMSTAGQADEPRENAVEQPVFGYIEDIAVRALGREMRAKMDSGATTTSIDARDIEVFEKDGEEWVRFTITGREEGRTATIERPVSRTVRIKRHGRSSQKRYVVELALCLGDKWVAEEVSLTNREKFRNGLLVGRNHMAGHLLIDPSEKDLQPPRCDRILLRAR
ncbi:MAG: ATP-dependent zinc protease [Pseudomonadota bacterium]